MKSIQKTKSDKANTKYMYKTMREVSFPARAWDIIKCSI